MHKTSYFSDPIYIEIFRDNNNEGKNMKVCAYKTQHLEIIIFESIDRTLYF